MNWAIKIISKTLMTKISYISWGDYDKGFYGNMLSYKYVLIYINVSIVSINWSLTPKNVLLFKFKYYDIHSKS